MINIHSLGRISFSELELAQLFYWQNSHGPNFYITRPDHVAIAYANFDGPDKLIWEEEYPNTVKMATSYWKDKGSPTDFLDKVKILPFPGGRVKVSAGNIMRLPPYA